MTAQTDRLNTALDGRYRIIRHLGEGGMATVYLCEDLKHDRKVALKLLKPELAAVLGAERFVVEIKTTASMSHPHILPLFDSGTADGFLFYVMPFIEGETLRDKLNRETQLGIDEAVRIAREVLDALEYAHSHGVIHRDIKPENILLHGGHAMVADFGIALAVSAAAGGRLTETGLSLGTPHYMSPEQATAEKEISGRSDVYSLASVLYEMLTGNPPHTGASAQQIIMKIIAEPAEAVTKYRKSVPSNVAAATAKALEKLPADRFASAREFGEALVNASFTVASVGRGSVAKATSAIGRPRAASYAVGVMGAVLALVAAWGWLRPVPEPTLHVSIPPVAVTSFVPHLGPPALSPDGRTVVFTAQSDGQTRLYRRLVDGFTVEAITGTEDARHPFFSPDGVSVGFYTGARQLRKVPLAGGSPTTLAEIPFWSSGAIWRRDHTILMVSDAHGLYAVPDQGGPLTPLAETDTVIGVYQIKNQQELPDGRLLATRSRVGGGPRGLVTMDPGAREWRLLSASASGVFIQGGFLVASPRTEQLASRFDLSSGKTTGAPLAVLENAVGGVSVNARGDVAYFAQPSAPPHLLTLVDRLGNGTPVATAAGDFRHLRLSPDGTRLGLNSKEDLWVLDLRTSTMVRLTTSKDITEPQWSPDGRRIAHTVYDSTTGRNPPVIRNADGSGAVRMITTPEGDAWTSDWSPDGRHLAIYGGKIGMNVFVLDLDSAQAVHPVTRLTAIARNPRFSPDGRWLAYQSNETGRMQIYVVSYPSLDQRRPISTEGGTEPAWRPLGGELYYRNGASMMAVTVRTGATLDVGTPRELFRGDFLEDQFGDRSYDVMPDGQHFIMLRANPAAAPDLRVIRNWSRELKATVPR